MKPVGGIMNDQMKQEVSARETNLKNMAGLFDGRLSRKCPGSCSICRLSMSAGGGCISLVWNMLRAPTKTCSGVNGNLVISVCSAMVANTRRRPAQREFTGPDPRQLTLQSVRPATGEWLGLAVRQLFPPMRDAQPPTYTRASFLKGKALLFRNLIS